MSIAVIHAAMNPSRRQSDEEIFVHSVYGLLGSGWIVNGIVGQ